MQRFVLALFLATGCPALAQEGDPVTSFSNSDPKMNAAILAAQTSLPLFLCESLNEEGYGPDGGFLKVQHPTKNAEVEFENIWAGPFVAWDGENFAAFLANQPHGIPGLNRGDQIDFTYDMIVDWSWYKSDGTAYGNYTTRVIYRQAGDSESLAALSQLADPPFDDSWSCE